LKVGPNLKAIENKQKPQTKERFLNMATTLSTKSYTVKSGDTLSGIALKFDMTVAELQSLNNISNPDSIYVGQVLKVYDNSAPAPDSGTTTYTVKMGDTLSGIAVKFGMSQSELQSLNNISNPDNIFVGQVLKVKDTNSGPIPNTTTYTVKSGDNLGSIALAFNMSISELQSLNNISNPDQIRVGQVLTVYQNNNNSTPGTSIYIVKSGDTLSGIAAKFDMTQAELQSLNNISDPNKLQIGQELKVYQTSNDGGSGGGDDKPNSTTYVVKSGDTLSGIAAKFNMTQTELQRLNGITNPDLIQIGQVLTVYQVSGGGGGSTPETKTYIVQSGDTLSGIAVRFNMTQAELQKLNNISDPNKIRVGQELLVYGSDDGGGSDPAPTPDTTTYTVRSGDYLGGIALRFDMTLAQIQELNGISNPDQIYVGQVLTVFDNGSGGGGTNPGDDDPVDTGGTGKYVSESQLNQIGWSSSNLNQDILDDLNNCLEEFNITTPARMRHFISQCSHESAAGLYREELASGWDYEYRSDLGNTQAGDGPKYKGGGYIQLTGRYNYTAFADAIGDSSIVDIGVKYVAANYPWSSAGFWWSKNNMNAMCDRGASVSEVTRRVNGGYNGLADRQMYYNRCVNVIK
jgi:LysM repeat protein/predicted chitinase